MRRIFIALALLIAGLGVTGCDMSVKVVGGRTCCVGHEPPINVCW